jgi:hypothetical protein
MQIIKILLHFLLYEIVAVFHGIVDNLHKLSVKLMPARA